MDYIKILDKLKPFIAIIVLLFIVLSCTQLIKYNKLQKEIKDTCGYENNEKVYCVCDKDTISQFKITGNPYYKDSIIDNFNYSGGE